MFLYFCNCFSSSFTNTVCFLLCHFFWYPVDSQSKTPEKGDSKPEKPKSSDRKAKIWRPFEEKEILERNPLACGMCGKIFASVTSRKRHEKTHLGIRNWLVFSYSFKINLNFESLKQTISVQFLLQDFFPKWPSWDSSEKSYRPKTLYLFNMQSWILTERCSCAPSANSFLDFFKLTTEIPSATFFLDNLTI